MTEDLTMGVIGTSMKENERRIPIHPIHIPQISEKLRERIYFEKGYSSIFGYDNEYLVSHSAGVLNRDDLFDHCDIILLPKPIEKDFSYFRQGQILWGWPHCVQDKAITQLGIDNKLTFIAFEAMFLWKSENIRDLHIFHRNNELAGYCSTLHALQLIGSTGHYGPKKRVAVISFGSTGRGAIHALKGIGFNDITFFTMRPYHKLNAPIPSLLHRQYFREKKESSRVLVKREGENRDVPMVKELSNYDIIINCVLQDTESPIIFINNDDIDQLKHGTLIIDVSCDLKMGFEFARPTSFKQPIFRLGGGDNITYYAVDHTPTYLWNASSYEISLALCPYIENVMNGKDKWEQDITIQKAIEIEKGVIRNPKILSFQNRTNEYPYKIIL